MGRTAGLAWWEFVCEPGIGPALGGMPGLEAEARISSEGVATGVA